MVLTVQRSDVCLSVPAPGDFTLLRADVCWPTELTAAVTSDLVDVSPLGGSVNQWTDAWGTLSSLLEGVGLLFPQWGTLSRTRARVSIPSSRIHHMGTSPRIRPRLFMTQECGTERDNFSWERSQRATRPTGTLSHSMTEFLDALPTRCPRGWTPLPLSDSGRGLCGPGGAPFICGTAPCPSLTSLAPSAGP